MTDPRRRNNNFTAQFDHALWAVVLTPTGVARFSWPPPAVTPHDLPGHFFRCVSEQELPTIFGENCRGDTQQHTGPQCTAIPYRQPAPRYM